MCDDHVSLTIHFSSCDVTRYLDVSIRISCEIFSNDSNAISFGPGVMKDTKVISQVKNSDCVWSEHSLNLFSNTDL